MANPFQVVRDFEQELARYAGAQFAVSTDSCTNAIFLSLLLEKKRLGKLRVTLPKRTYVGVAMAVKNAGHEIEWTDKTWLGSYAMPPTRIVDSAKRFHRWMYFPGSLICLSFQCYKHLPIGRGGAILCDREEDATWLRKARFDGRTEGARLQAPESFDVLGWHMYMTPPDAARGLWLLSNAKDSYPDQVDTYQDLSEIGLFRSLAET